MLNVVDSLTDFVSAFENRFHQDAPETFWQCESLFRELNNDAFVQRAINESLREIAADPLYFGDWAPNQMMIKRGPAYALALSLFDTPRRYIHTTPFFGFYSPVSGVPLRYQYYKFPPNYDNSVFSPSIRLEPMGEGIVEPHGVLQIRSDLYAYDFEITEPLLVLKLTTSAYQMLEWLFNKDSLMAWQANDAVLASTQLRVAAYVLGRLSHQSSVEPLKVLAGHPNSAVRWSAIQNLGRIDRGAALSKLQEAVNDRHPHVRNAARKTLENLQKKSER